MEVFNETGITFYMGDVKASRKQLEFAYGVSKQAMQRVISALKADGLLVGSKIKSTARDGKRYDTEVFNLDEILAVGLRLRSDTAIKLQRWAIELIKKERTEAIEKIYYLQIENDRLWDKDDNKRLYR